MPLDLGALSDARRGWAREEAASELRLKRLVYEQEQGWKDLSRKFEEAKKKLVLTVQIETAQLSKVRRERERLNQGRSTTYLTLLFEQDFAQSQLARIHAEADVLAVIAQMELFGEAP